MIEALFWVSAILIAYIYVGYPALMMLLARLFKRSVRKAPFFPSITVLIAAHNEAKHIEATVRNKLAQNYPAELLDVIVVSDESYDGTDEIVRGLGPRVQLIRQSPRAGKTAALNLAISRVKGEILVFSDANSIYGSDAIRRLMENFADPNVGYVTGKMIYVDESGSMIGDGCSTYMKYENWLRAQESALAGVIGVDGGIDAVRSSLYMKMRADQLPDFVLPLSVAARGYRVVYEPLAILKEAALTEQEAEYRMRVRVGLRAMWALHDMRGVLNPIRHGLLALQVVSHKLLRYFAFVPLVLVFGTSLALSGSHAVYGMAASCQLVFYALAVIGWTNGSRLRSPFVIVPYYFSLLNVATAHAAIRFLRGERQATWQPRVG